MSGESEARARGSGERAEDGNQEKEARRTTVPRVSPVETDMALLFPFLIRAASTRTTDCSYLHSIEKVTRHKKDTFRKGGIYLQHFSAFDYEKHRPV